MVSKQVMQQILDFVQCAFTTYLILALPPQLQATYDFDRTQIECRSLMCYIRIYTERDPPVPNASHLLISWC